jgi:hypothetical protein
MSKKRGEILNNGMVLAILPKKGRWKLNSHLGFSKKKVEFSS